MNKVISIDQAAGMIKDGMIIMIGGFMGVKNPHRIIDAIAKKGTKNLTLIANDTAFPDTGIGKLIVNRQIKKLIAP